MRLLDFEYGAYRHALYDISAWAVLCPLPERLLWPMRETFQRTLADFLPAVDDAVLFRDGWGALCAYWAIALLNWVSPTVLEADRPFVGAWSARQTVLAALARGEAARRRQPPYPPSSQWRLLSASCTASSTGAGRIWLPPAACRHRGLLSTAQPRPPRSAI